MSAVRALIIDDDAIRVPKISAWLRSAFGVSYADLRVEHSLVYRSDWTGFDVVCLDNDLGAGGDVITHVLRDPPLIGSAQVVVHSMNPVAAQRLVDHFKTAIRVPFGQMLVKVRAN